jgi:ribosomal protein S11
MIKKATCSNCQVTFEGEEQKGTDFILHKVCNRFAPIIKNNKNIYKVEKTKINIHKKEDNMEEKKKTKAAEVRELHAQGVAVEQIVEQTGVPKARVKRILNITI